MLEHIWLLWNLRYWAMFYLWKTLLNWAWWKLHRLYPRLPKHRRSLCKSNWVPNRNYSSQWYQNLCRLYATASFHFWQQASKMCLYPRLQVIISNRILTHMHSNLWRWNHLVGILRLRWQQHSQWRWMQSSLQARNRI